MFQDLSHDPDISETCPSRDTYYLSKPKIEEPIERYRRWSIDQSSRGNCRAAASFKTWVISCHPGIIFLVLTGLKTGKSISDMHFNMILKREPH